MSGLFSRSPTYGVDASVRSSSSAILDELSPSSSFAGDVRIETVE